MSTVQPEGYLAVPESGTGRPVLVLHAWWGLNGTIRALCDRLAQAGFAAFAPDLYHGKVTDQISEAEKLGPTLNADQVRAELTEATRFIKERSGAGDKGVAVIGFSLGAYYAFDHSINDPENIKSVVIFYGAGEGDFSGAQAEYLGHIASDDPYEPKEYLDGVQEAIKQAGRPVTFYTYPNTTHWFFEPDRADVYNPEAAQLAWERTLDFLNRPSAQ